MKFFKPSWVSHDGNPIFSIDIHPDGTRFATGGQGPEKCGRVIIWNMTPILSPKDEERDNVPKKLCQMDNHLACINCVRWSNHGNYLASAGDDKNLIIWQLAGRINHHPSYQHQQQAQSNVFESANVEQWRCIASLNGHNGDILDLSWSTNDHYLASCSVDNMIIVWDANNFPQVITKITGHAGLVKGVSWDPAGKYLASQSDDKTLKIWRTSDWREEAVVTEPFKECGGTTHVLRLNWGPDGQTLVSAHAMNNSGSVAQLIERDSWRTQRDLVGHRKAVTCVRFNPNILYQSKTTKEHANSASKAENNGNSGNLNGTQSTTNQTARASSNKPIQAPTKAIKYCCIAIGSRDRSISVWLTCQPRPLIVAHDLFESSVLDISWSKDGYRLIACSQDGTVAVMMFSSSEIGNKLTVEEKQTHLQKLYGKSVTAAPTTSKTLVAEDPELLKAQVDQNHKHREMLEQNSSHSNSVSQNGYNGCESNTSMSGMSKGPTDRQIETLLPGGKRRITPLYIQPPVPFNSTSRITSSSSTESKTKIMIETTTSTPAPTPTPTFTQNAPVKTPANFTSTTIRRDVVASKINHRALPPSKIEKATAFRLKDAEGKELTLEAENDTNLDNLNELRLLDESNNKIWDTLISSKINSVIATQIFAASSCVDNSLHLFEVQSGRRLMPPVVLDSQVAHLAAEKDHLLVITSNASMWLWNLSRNKVLVKAESISLVLSPPNNNTTSTLTTEKPTKAQAKSTEKSSANKTDDSANNQPNSNNQTNSDIEIISCSLTEHHQPLILLSTGRAFVFDCNLHCWLLISDSNDSITRWSSCKPSLAAIKRFISHKQINLSDCCSQLKKNLPLTSLQSQHLFDIKRFAHVINKNGSESLQVKATRSYLDQQLASALAIKSTHEYHYWLIQSIQHYVDTGAESRLKELCSRLITSSLGKSEDYCGKNRIDSFKPAGDSNSDVDLTVTETNLQILGLNKLSLLKEVLSIISKDLRYQRIYSEYKQLLDFELESSADIGHPEGIKWAYTSTSSYMTMTAGKLKQHLESFRSSEMEIVQCRPDELKTKPSPDNLKFGQVFTDHMFRVDWDQENGWSTPLISKIQNLELHPAAKVFHYALGAFEGAKAYRGHDNKIRFFRLSQNVKRLQYSARRLSLPDFDESELIRCIHKLVQIEQEWIPDHNSSKPLTSLYIRPTILGVEPSLGVARSNRSILYILLSPVGPYFKTGFKPVQLYADPNVVRAWPGGAGNNKLSANYAPTIMVQTQAEQVGLQQVLWLYDYDAKLTEVGTMNIFIVYQNEKTGQKHLVTPPLDDGLILPGITRSSIIELARQWRDVVCEERYVTMNEIKQLIHENRLVEMFGSGTACVVCPISSIHIKNSGTLHIPSFDLTKMSDSHISTDEPILSKRILQTMVDIQYGKIPHPWAEELIY